MLLTNIRKFFDICKAGAFPSQDSDADELVDWLINVIVDLLPDQPLDPLAIKVRLLRSYRLSDLPSPDTEINVRVITSGEVLRTLSCQVDFTDDNKSPCYSFSKAVDLLGSGISFGLIVAKGDKVIVHERPVIDYERSHCFLMYEENSEDSYWALYLYKP